MVAPPPGISCPAVSREDLVVVRLCQSLSTVQNELVTGQRVGPRVARGARCRPADTAVRRLGKDRNALGGIVAEGNVDMGDGRPGSSVPTQSIRCRPDAGAGGTAGRAVLQCKAQYDR